jgi:hypothetical protein
MPSPGVQVQTALACINVEAGFAMDGPRAQRRAFEALAEGVYYSKSA